MPIIDETSSDGEFASIFESAAHEKRAREEKKHAQFLLQVLNDMDDQEDLGELGRTEHLRIGPSGDIIRDERDRARREKVMTVDDLPKESEYEMLFGKAEPQEPPLIVETGRRLADGSKKQNLLIPALENYRMDLGSVRFEAVVLAISVGLLICILLWRGLKWLARRSNHQEEPAYYYNSNIKDHIEMEVQRRVAECLFSLLKKEKQMGNI